MATQKRDSRIVAEMLETARGLQVAGLLTRRRMGEFNALALVQRANEPVGPHNPGSK